MCLVKWGKKYGPEYVNRLARALRRQGRGVLGSCASLDNGEGVDNALVEVRGLPKEGRFRGWEGWWYKSYLFSEEATRVLGEGGVGGVRGPRHCRYGEADVGAGGGEEGFQRC